MKPLLRFTFCLLLFVSGIRAQSQTNISLAVSDLEAHGVKENEAVVLSEQLRMELLKLPRIQLIERSRMQEILKEQGFQQSGCTNDACAVEVGQLLGVRYIVVGSAGLAGSYTVLSARIIDVSTGQVVVNESIRTKGGIDAMLETGVTSIARKMHQGLFPETATVSPKPAPKKNPGLKIAAVVGGGTLLVGGGVAALLLLNQKDAPDNSPTPNTRIDLP